VNFALPVSCLAVQEDFRNVGRCIHCGSMRSGESREMLAVYPRSILLAYRRDRRATRCRRPVCRLDSKHTLSLILHVHSGVFHVGRMLTSDNPVVF